MRPFFWLSLVLLLVVKSAAQGKRTIIDLNGQWSVEESISDRPPLNFAHTVPVPGLINLAEPAFEQAGEFYSREYGRSWWIKTFVQDVKMDPDEPIGITSQKRNYFWYKQSFKLPEKRKIAVLKIGKAQFGTTVWVNGKKAGEYLSSFSSSYFDISDFIDFKKENEILIRVGAHPLVLPPEVPFGTDWEKVKWTPGIYDDVSLILCDGPYIETIQVAPDIDKLKITVETIIVPDAKRGQVEVNYEIRERGSREVIISDSEPVTWAGDNKKTIRKELGIPDMHLWSPEDPFLYELTVSTKGDEVKTRFGMRKFHFDSKTKKAYLNNQIYYLRGSNITLHRFFDDPASKAYPWDRDWVRRLLGDVPDAMNWNSFRFSIGPVPDFWFDIADEEGLIIQNEFFIWPYREFWDTDIIAGQVKDWMRDSWNHPSVGWWDICNENHGKPLRGIIDEVRSVDLSNRAWDAGYNLPVGPDDPIEDHHYKKIGSDGWSFASYENTTAETSTNAPHPSAHACVLNEYGWLWLNRDGAPAILTSATYDKMASGIDNQERIELAAYTLALETEYFRAHRNYAGVLHFALLGNGSGRTLTGDLFQNIEETQLHPAYADYLSEAFKPLGVFLNFSRDSMQISDSHHFRVMMINDEYLDHKGKLKVVITNSAGVLVNEASTKFDLPGLGQQTYELMLKLPKEEGKFWISAIASPEESLEETISKRKVVFYHPN